MEPVLQGAVLHVSFGSNSPVVLDSFCDRRMPVTS